MPAANFADNNNDTEPLVQAEEANEEKNYESENQPQIFLPSTARDQEFKNTSHDG